jgi:hypothetical protein
MAIIYMTKHTDSFRQIERDRPVLDIEVTPQMIEAGAAVYRASRLAFDPCDGGAELVADVFSAMIGARELARTRQN